MKKNRSVKMIGALISVIMMLLAVPAHAAENPGSFAGLPMENPTSFPQLDASDFSDDTYISTPAIELSENQKLSLSSSVNRRPALSVAVMRIYALGDSSSSSGGNFGHAWISITNLNGSPLKIGGLTVADNKAITVGTWGNTDPRGLWYNAEGYAQSHGTTWSKSVSIQRPLRQVDLDIVNENIASHTSWSPLNNCSSFASQIWNSVAPDSEEVSAGGINMPKNLADSIRALGKEISWSLFAEGYRVPFDYPTYHGNPPTRKDPTFDNASTSSLGELPEGTVNEE